VADRTEGKYTMRDYYTYRIDTIAVPVHYTIVNYDPSNLDSIIFYVSLHDQYVENPLYEFSEYLHLSFTTTDPSSIYYKAGFCAVGRSTANASVQKGLGAEPLSYYNAPETRSFRYAYALTTADSVIPFTHPDSLSWLHAPKFIDIPINLEVPAGNVVSVVYQFQPGYAYTDGDTLMISHIDKDLEKYTAIDRRQNILAIPDYEIHDSMSTKYAYSFDKAGGLNSHFMVDEQDRYNWYDATDTNNWEHSYTSGGNTIRFYAYNYYAYAMGYLALSIGDEFISIKVDSTDAVTEISNNLLSSVSPNPAKDQITVTLKNGQNANLEIVNVLGQVVKTVNTDNQKTTIDIADLTAGVYVLKVYQDRQIQSTKIVKR
jgi:hypothetical protein